MKILKRPLALAMMAVAASWAGALTLEISKPDTNPEAKGMGALLIARTTACHDPAQSKITASFVRADGRDLKRTQLKVVRMQTPGTFAIVGAVPAGSVIDLAVTNPEYKNYEPRTLILSDAHGVQWASVRRFFGAPPTDSDVKSILGELD